MKFYRFIFFSVIFSMTFAVHSSNHQPTAQQLLNRYEQRIQDIRRAIQENKTSHTILMKSLQTSSNETQEELKTQLRKLITSHRIHNDLLADTARQYEHLACKLFAQEQITKSRYETIVKQTDTYRKQKSNL